MKSALKKLGSSFTALVLAAVVCLTMAVPVAAQDFKLPGTVNYRDYMSFVISGTEYAMNDLTSGSVDLSSSDKETPVYAKINVDGLNQAINNGKTYVVHEKAYMSYRTGGGLDYVVKFNFQAADNDTYAIVAADGHNMTLGEFALVDTVALYVGETADASSTRYGMDSLVNDLFPINVAGTYTAEAEVSFVGKDGTVYLTYGYVKTDAEGNEETGKLGKTTLVNYKDLPHADEFQLESENGGKYIAYGYEDNVIKVTVTAKNAPNFDGLLAVLEEVENMEEKNYTEDSMQALLDAVEQAQAVAEKGNDAFQFEVDEAKAAVENAIANLKEVPAADKGALKDALDQYEVADSKDYTEASWAAYKEAYEAAVKVYKDENATQEQIDNALAALDKAADGLKKAGTADEKPAAPGTSGQTAGTAAGAPVTGDASSVQAYAAVMALAAAAVVFAKRKSVH